jgi:sensor histidine kinase regulating citrate/malate metabolism
MPAHIASVLTDDDPGPAVRADRGLGLWMVRQMIDDLGGKIVVDRRPSGGTLVRLLIPVGTQEDNVHAV